MKQAITFDSKPIFSKDDTKQIFLRLKEKARLIVKDLYPERIFEETM
jgi:hypothetical protein